MKTLHWIGIIVWGLFVAGCGLSGAGAGESAPPQDVMFLIVGGMVTCLIGLVRLAGFAGWIPGLRTEQKSYS
jgi:hypothetical protein